MKHAQKRQATTTRERARSLLPSVLLTLLSMLQALALELFWTRIQSAEALWLGGFPAFLAWLQVVAVGVGILEIWLFYMSLLLRFTWVPSVRDMLLPFGIGLLEFVLIDLTGRENAGLWLLCLSLIVSVSVTESHLIFRAARRDESNAEFFRDVPRATMADFYPQIAAVLPILCIGLITLGSGASGWLAAAGVIYGIVALAWEMLVTSRYWSATISGRALEEEESEDGT